MTDFDAIYKDDAFTQYTMKAGEKFVFLSELLNEKLPSDVKFSEGDLGTLRENFYNLMKYRCKHAQDSLSWLEQNKDTLPMLSNELLNEKEPQWFPVPGMYGGFSYGLFEREGSPVLITDSWVRVVGGSGERHEITVAKVELVARGFV